MTDTMRRARNCWYGDRRTHLAGPVGINNIRTACGRWVGYRFRDQPRSAPVTCPACLDAVTPCPEPPQTIHIHLTQSTPGAIDRMDRQAQRENRRNR